MVVETVMKHTGKDCGRVISKEDEEVEVANSGAPFGT